MKSHALSGATVFAESVGKVSTETGAEAQVKYAFANPAAIADNAVVASVVGKKIRVLAYTLNNTAGTANTATFKSAAAAISSAKALGAVNSFFASGYSKHGWFETVAGEALNLALTAGTAVGVDVVYIEV